MAKVVGVLRATGGSLDVQCFVKELGTRAKIGTAAHGPSIFRSFEFTIDQAGGHSTYSHENTKQNAIKRFSFFCIQKSQCDSLLSWIELSSFTSVKCFITCHAIEKLRNTNNDILILDNNELH